MKQSKAIKEVCKPLFTQTINHQDLFILGFQLAVAGNNRDNNEVKKLLIAIGQEAHKIHSWRDFDVVSKLIQAERERQYQKFGFQDNEIWQEICILQEEMYELIIELNANNRENAYTEAVQVMAVCIRILESDLFN